MILRKGRWVGDRKGSRYRAPAIEYDWANVAVVTIMDGRGRVLRVVTARIFKLEAVKQDRKVSNNHVKHVEVQRMSQAAGRDRDVGGGAGRAEEGAGGASEDERGHGGGGE